MQLFGLQAAPGGVVAVAPCTMLITPATTISGGNGVTILPVGPAPGIPFPGPVGATYPAGTLIDCGVQWDSADAWAIGEVLGASDVNSVATHEQGHANGLSHSTVGLTGFPSGATMVPAVSQADTQLRSLEADDIASILRTYSRFNGLTGTIAGRAQIVGSVRAGPGCALATGVSVLAYATSAGVMDANQVETFSGSQLREALPGHPSNGSFQLNVLPGVSYTLAARTLELGASTLLGVNRYNRTTVFGNNVTFAGGSQFFDTLATAGSILPGETRNVGNLAILGCGGGGGNLPDLILTEFSADTVGESGEPIQVFVRLFNRGPLPAGPFRLGFYLSQDGILSPAEAFAACTHTNGLSSGFGTTCSGGPLLPDVSPGIYHLGAFIDDLSQITELNENNNIRFTNQLIVGALPPQVMVFRQGAWLPFDFATGQSTAGVWTGKPSSSCIPLRMDYDGDAADEFTQFCNGAWHFYNDNGSYLKGIWTGGAAGDVPVPADYDGNGTNEVVVFRNGAWLFFDFGTGAFDAAKSRWTGAPPHWLGGKPAPAPMDYDGDGAADFTVYSGGPWHFYNDNGSYLKGIWTGGVAGDVPVPGDYHGLNHDEVVVFRNGAWLFFDFGTGQAQAGNSVWTGRPAHWNGGISMPAPVDYDGDGTLDFTVYAGGPWHFYNDNGSYHKGLWTGGVVGDIAVSALPLIP